MSSQKSQRNSSAAPCYYDHDVNMLEYSKKILYVGKKRSNKFTLYSGGYLEKDAF